MPYSILVHKAMDFAALAHADQPRKKGNIPFISHCAMVAGLVKGAGWDDTVVAAALLHDVLEDTSVEFEELEESFGPEVAELVAAVSEKEKSLRWEERKRDYLEQIKTAPDGALAIATADKIHNIHSMILYHESGGDLWSISKGTRDQQLWYFGTVREILRKRFGQAPERKIGSLIGELESALRALQEEY